MNKRHQKFLVAEGYDIGIRGWVIEDSSLIAHRVCTSPVVLTASRAYLERMGVPVSMDDLGRHRCATFRVARGPAQVWHFRSPGGGDQRCLCASNRAANSCMRERFLPQSNRPNSERDR